MSPVDHSLFRASLRTVLGEEKYRKFIAAGVVAPLRYWQEAALRDFFEARPQLRLDADQLAQALRVCEVHGKRLQATRVEVFQGHLNFNPEYLRRRRELFPHAAIDKISAGGREGLPPFVDAYFCSDCRQAREAWRPGR